jgi:hypothetical protein
LLQDSTVGHSILPVSRPLNRSSLSQLPKGSHNDLSHGSELLGQSCLRHSKRKRGRIAHVQSGARGGQGALRSFLNESSQTRLNASRGVLVNSLHKTLHAQRQTPQKEERESRVHRDSLCHSRVSEKQASCRLGGYRSGGVGIAREEGHFPERCPRLTGVDYRLTAPANPDDAHFPFENKRNSF